MNHVITFEESSETMIQPIGGGRRISRSDFTKPSSELLYRGIFTLIVAGALD